MLSDWWSPIPELGGLIPHNADAPTKVAPGGIRFVKKSLQSPGFPLNGPRAKILNAQATVQA